MIGNTNECIQRKDWLVELMEEQMRNTSSTYTRPCTTIASLRRLGRSTGPEIRISRHESSVTTVHTIPATDSGRMLPRKKPSCGTATLFLYGVLVLPGIAGL